MEKARITARIDAELHRQTKILAAKERTTIEALFEEAIRALLAGRKKRAD